MKKELSIMSGKLNKGEYKDIIQSAFADMPLAKRKKKKSAPTKKRVVSEDAPGVKDL